MYVFSFGFVIIMWAVGLGIYLLAYIPLGVLLARLIPAFRSNYKVYAKVAPVVLCATLWMVYPFVPFPFFLATLAVVPIAWIGLRLTRHLRPPKQWSASELLDGDQLRKL